MEKDEGLTTRLWLEGYENPHSEKREHALYYSIKKFKFDKNEIKELQIFCKKKHISWQILIEAAWGLVLDRFSASDSISFGLSSLVSLRAKTLKTSPIQPIKSLVSPKLSLLAFIKQFKKQSTKKNVNKDLLLDEIRYLLVFKSGTIKKTKNVFSPNLELYPLILFNDPKKPDEIIFFYNEMIFWDQTLSSIFIHLKIILKTIAKNSRQKVVDVNLLTFDEKLRINEWAKPKYPFLRTPISGCSHDVFGEQARKYPNRIAVSHNKVNLTYKQLDDASTALAHQLITKGVKQGKPVCVLMDRTPTLIIAMLAVFKAGAIYVPISTKYPDERIFYILNDTQSKFILVNDETKLLNKHHAQIIKIDSVWNSKDFQTNTTKPLEQIDPEQIAYIIYTSGTTGQPKGVMIRHKGLTNLIGWYRDCFKITDQDRSAQFATQGFDTFFCETIPHLGCGSCICIVDDHIKLSPLSFFLWLEEEKITVCDLPTAYAQMLLTMTWPRNIPLRLLKIGGESVTHYPTQKFPFDIWNGYGPTETTVECTYTKLYSAHSEPPEKKSVPPIGKPISQTEAYIVDKYLQLVPLGIGGELLIGGVGVSAGYINRPELTAEKFIPHILEKDSNQKLYRTGDLVRWHTDGNLEFIGRVDNQIKIRGYRVELGDIESALIQHPDVNEVVVIAKENFKGEKSLIAYVVPNLDKARYLYQERCLLAINDRFIETITEDISKHGLALSGISESIAIGKSVKVHLKLPGLTESRLFSGRLIWQEANRCGVAFDLSNEEEKVLNRSIDYYLSKHNVMELVLSTSAKRSLRKALKKLLPEYMVPPAFVTLLQFPLTFSGKIDIKALPQPHEFEEFLQKQLIPPKTPTEKKLVQIWSQLLGKNNISMTDNFFDLGGNSLTAAELSLNILNQFKKSVPAQVLFDLPYIPILADYIDTQGKEYETKSLVQEEIQRDAQLHENIIPTQQLSPTLFKPKNILLTGAGGFLGIYMLRELLKQTDAKIYCLIRKGEFETAAKRLISTLEKFNLHNEITLNDRRIIVIASDISFDRFGLPLEQYNSLVDKIDSVYHCGAQVSIMSAYQKLRGSNVQGTIEVIKFATLHHDKPIYYISTLSATSKADSEGNLIEEFPDESYEGIFGGYGISKWVSERLLTQIKNRGLPVSIFRSGYIAGQSDTGITNLNDALFMLIKGCIQLGLAPDMLEKITMLPVDFVSQAIIKISLEHPNASDVYHIDHPVGILWTDLISWLNDYGYQIKIIPMKEWQEKLLKISKDNALFPFLPYYLALDPNYKSPEVSVQHTSDKLHHVGLDYPKLDDELLTTYFDYLCQIEFFPMPAKTKKRTTIKG